MSVRQHRRYSFAAAGLAVAALTGGSALAVPAEAAPPPAPHAKHRTQAGTRNLPAAATMAWHETGDWKSEGTTTSTEPTSTTPCTTRPVNDYRGAEPTTWERAYALRATPGPWAAAVLTQFDTAAHASAAERAVTRALAKCGATLQAAGGYVEVGQPSPSRRVATKTGKARFTETSYQTTVDVDADPDSWTFEATATVRDGRRLLVLTMTTHGQDDNWSYVVDDPTELPLHPMFRTLPAAAQRLAR